MYFISLKVWGLPKRISRILGMPCILLRLLCGCVWKCEIVSVFTMNIEKIVFTQLIKTGHCMKINVISASGTAYEESCVPRSEVTFQRFLVNTLMI